MPFQFEDFFFYSGHVILFNETKLCKKVIRKRFDFQNRRSEAFLSHKLLVKDSP